MALPIPTDPDQKKYLGLSGNRSFKITEIKTEVLVIEIYSMYCTVCQKDAPGINEMYRTIESRPELKGRIKLIGIGAGNSVYEVEIYKKTFGVLFPLFPDRDFDIHNSLGEVRTPYFFGVKMEKDRPHRVVYSEEASFKEPNSFLQSIIEVSGLK